VWEKWREATFSQCVARVATLGHFTVPMSSPLRGGSLGGPYVGCDHNYREFAR
jgi:hypothetical protein